MTKISYSAAADIAEQRRIEGQIRWASWRLAERSPSTGRDRDPPLNQEFAPWTCAVKRLAKASGRLDNGGDNADG
jgi:hypothetical protein